MNKRKQKQPPSGGCVLKPVLRWRINFCLAAAAFGRLCVETPQSIAHTHHVIKQPPSGGCVLKQNNGNL